MRWQNDRPLTPTRRKKNEIEATRPRRAHGAVILRAWCGLIVGSIGTTPNAFDVTCSNCQRCVDWTKGQPPLALNGYHYEKKRSGIG